MKPSSRLRGFIWKSRWLKVWTHGFGDHRIFGYAINFFGRWIDVEYTI